MLIKRSESIGTVLGKKAISKWLSHALDTTRKKEKCHGNALFQLKTSEEQGTGHCMRTSAVLLLSILNKAGRGIPDLQISNHDQLAGPSVKYE